MPRKKKNETKKGYFYEKEEAAIVDYINADDENEKNRIFNTILYPALTKMIESIIRRYKLFIPNEDFQQNFDDTISYLLTKINHFRPVITGYTQIDSADEIESNDFHLMAAEEMRLKVRNATAEDPEYVVVYPDTPKKVTKYYHKTVHRYKAYSYCGTVCKNYLMYKSTQYNKNLQRNTSYEEVYKDINNDMKYATGDEGYSSTAQKLIRNIADEIEKMIEKPELNELNENEIKVGNALITLLRHWEEVLPEGGSNKLQKSSVLYFLREETMMKTKDVRSNMRKYKCIFNILKNMELSYR